MTIHYSYTISQYLTNACFECPSFSIFIEVYYDEIFDWDVSQTIHHQERVTTYQADKLVQDYSNQVHLDCHPLHKMKWRSPLECTQHCT